MTDSSKLIHDLKHAANYAKLGMRDLGPRSFKKGQGALIKVVYKFSEDGTVCKEKLERVLGWRGQDVRHVAEKAERNGYVTIQDPEYKFLVSLTDKGQQVIQKRMKAEDRAADAILEALSAEERQQLQSITEKICKTCEELGVDYSQIKERKGHKGCRKQKRAGGRKGCCERRHGHGHGCRHSHGAKAVIVIK